MKENFKIRRIKKEDWKPVTDLIAECYREVNAELDFEGYDSDLQDIESSYLSKDGDFVVLEIDKQIIGTRAFVAVNSSTVVFKRLYLEKIYRGSKAAKLLMEWGLNTVKEKGFKYAISFSDVDAVRAHKFFEKYGFEKQELIPPNAEVPYEQFKFYKVL